MSIRIRYRPNHSDFAQLLLSQQTLELALAAAADIRDLARRMAGVAYRMGDIPEGYTESFSSEPGAPMELGGNLRATARVVNDHPLAAVIEFGSGVQSVGETKGKPRRQGGYSFPNRFLGRAASVYSSPPSGAKP